MLKEVIDVNDLITAVHGFLPFITRAWSRTISQTCSSDHTTHVYLVSRDRRPRPARAYAGWTNKHPSITTMLCIPGLTVSASPYQPSLSIDNTNVDYILHNRLIALLQNAVCVLLTHFGKFLVTQPRYNGESNDSLQAGSGMKPATVPSRTPNKNALRSLDNFYVFSFRSS